MFNFLKSKTRRVQDDLDFLEGAVAVGIAALESTKFHPEDRHAVARVCRHALLVCPRGAEGVATLDQIMAASRGNDVATYEAAKLAGAIVSAVWEVNAKLRGKASWGTAMIKVSIIQARVEAYMKRQGVAAWGVPYYIVSEFEALALAEKEGGAA